MRSRPLHSFARRMATCAILVASPTGVFGGEALPIPELARPTAAMVAWAEANVPHHGDPEARLEALLRALSADPVPGLVYDPEFTATAAEVFAEARFNCLSFSHLFLGLARSLGIPVEYYEAPPWRFAREGDLILAAGHVTVGVGSGPRRRILEIGVRPPEESRRAVPISDQRAHALQWLNLGTRDLLDGDRDGAEGWFRRALELDPGLAAAWTSLGVLARRRGDFPGAEAYYRRAIEIDGEHLAAYHNLFSLLQITGRKDAALEISNLLARRRNRNPFAWLSLAELSVDQGRLEDATRFLRRAGRLAPDDPEILAARGELALAKGETRKAMRWLRRAQRQASHGERVERLAAALEVDGSG